MTSQNVTLVFLLEIYRHLEFLDSRILQFLELSLTVQAVAIGLYFYMPNSGGILANKVQLSQSTWCTF